MTVLRHRLGDFMTARWGVMERKEKIPHKEGSMTTHLADSHRTRQLWANGKLNRYVSHANFVFFALSSLFFSPNLVAAPSRPKTLPPSWKQSSRTTNSALSRRERPWYLPKVAFGGGLNLLEIVPLEVWLLSGDYLGLRLFYAPEYPFHARVEMPSDVISTKRGLGVANPDFTINLDIRYGPQYGFELVSFPFAGSFFVGGGISMRGMKVAGTTQSNILVCSLIEAAKDPPCGNPNARLETQTELRIEADLESQATLGRLVTGGFWHIGTSGYFTLTVGMTSPMGIRRSSQIRASLDTAASKEPEITGALAEVKEEKQAELSAKAIREMRPVDERLLPLLGFGVGVRL